MEPGGETHRTTLNFKVFGSLPYRQPGGKTIQSALDSQARGACASPREARPGQHQARGACAPPRGARLGQRDSGVRALLHEKPAPAINAKVFKPGERVLLHEEPAPAKLFSLVCVLTLHAVTSPVPLSDRLVRSIKQMYISLWQSWKSRVPPPVKRPRLSKLRPARRVNPQ